MGLPRSTIPTFGIAIVVGVLFATAVALFPVYVLVDGVRCYNFWGMYRTVKWAEVGEIRPANMFRLRYLTVASTSGGTARSRVPLYLSNMDRFVASIRDRAGPEHTLVAVPRALSALKLNTSGVFAGLAK